MKCKSPTPNFQFGTVIVLMISVVKIETNVVDSVDIRLQGCNAV
jgi:hypothetical protein